MGVSTSGCLPRLGTASSPRAALGQAAAPCGEQSRGCSAPIDSTQLSQVHPVPSNFHRPHSSSHPSRAPCTSPHSHRRPTAAGLPRFCPPGQHYNFNPKALALDISPTLTSLAGPLALRQPRGALQAVTPPLSCTQLMKEPDEGGRLSTKSKPGHLQLLWPIPSPPSWPPSLSPFPFPHPPSHRLQMQCLHRGASAADVQSRATPGRTARRANASHLPASHNSSSALVSECTGASLQRSCPPTPGERLGGGSPGASEAATAQPFSGGSSRPPRAPRHPTPARGGQTRGSAILPLPSASSLQAQAEQHQNSSEGHGGLL